MIDKFVRSMAEAMNGIKDGSTILIPGFGEVGQPNALLDGLIEQGATDLTLVVNSAGRIRPPGAPPNGHVARLIDAGRVRKVITSFVRANSVAGEWVKAGKLEAEVIPQGTLAERIRAAGAGVPAGGACNASSARARSGSMAAAPASWNWPCPAMSR